MDKNSIKCNQRVVFKCSRDKNNKRGLISNIGLDKAKVFFYDGKYTSSQDVPFDDIIQEDIIDTDVRKPI